MRNSLRPKLGIDSFTYHRHFGEVGEWEEPLPTRWSTVDFLDRAAELGVDAVSLQTVFLEDLSIGGMRALREEVATRGLSSVLAWGHRSGLESGTSPARFEEAMICLDLAAVMGVRLVRIVCGDQLAWSTPPEHRKDRLVPLLSRLAWRARQLDLELAIENHADLAMVDLVDLVSSVEAPNLGICFDLGNAVRVGDDPVEAAALAGPLVQMVHVKDLAVQEDSVGQPSSWWPSVPLGRGDIDLAAALETTRGSTPSAGWFVEMGNMHPDHTDEDTAVVESLEFLRALVP